MLISIGIVLICAGLAILRLPVRGFISPEQL
jgi:hypothetical protein